MLFHVRSYCQIINRDMFFCFGGYTDLVSVFVGADVNGSLFDTPDPEGQYAIKDGVDGYGDGGIEFCIVEAVGVVPVEAGGTNGESGVAEC